MTFSQSTMTLPVILADPLLLPLITMVDNVNTSRRGLLAVLQPVLYELVHVLICLMSAFVSCPLGLMLLCALVICLVGTASS